MRISIILFVSVLTSILAGCFRLPEKTMNASIPAGQDIAIEAQGSAGTLRGVLRWSAHRKGPVALIIAGSGPINRDGNSSTGIHANSYRLLAEELSVNGVSTGRFDKRGIFESEGGACGADCVTLNDYVDDVHQWIKVLKAKTAASCVWMIGHSEGGLVAIAAARELPDICGIVLLAAPGRRISDVLREQLSKNPANVQILPDAMKAIDALEAGRPVDVEKLDPIVAQLFRPSVQNFLISLFSFDPTSQLKGYSKPALIVQGLRDIQVTDRDARLLQEALPSARLVLLPNLNHVLKDVAPDDFEKNLAAYRDPLLPLGNSLASTIAEFLRRNSS